jgi:ribosomal protein S18 acetylase RimI-like enzyme
VSRSRGEIRREKSVFHRDDDGRPAVNKYCRLRPANVFLILTDVDQRPKGDTSGNFKPDQGAGHAESIALNRGDTSHLRRGRMRSESTPSGELLLRGVDRIADASALFALDTSYQTDHVYEVQSSGAAINLQLRSTSSPQHGRFTIDLNVPIWSEGFVAIVGGELCGFIATDYQTWNRRLAIWHFYVDAKFRHLGIGRRLMTQAVESGRQRGAGHAWAETSNRNYPAVQVYRRLGFEICGFDLFLYSGTPSEGDFALYLASPIRG